MRGSLPRVRWRGTRVQVLADALSNVKPILKKVGLWLVRATQQAFRAQARGMFGWKKRRVPNIPGVLRDMERGITVPGRRFKDRPALVDTGMLRNSIAYEFVNPTTIRFGTNLPYAAVHQRGGVSKIRLMPVMLTNLAIWLRSQQGEKWRDSFGWVFSKKPGSTLSFRVAKRPFVLVSEGDRAEIRRIIADQIAGDKAKKAAQ